eukprot:763545-Hanusia_phi.AAC.4
MADCPAFRKPDHPVGRAMWRNLFAICEDDGDGEMVGMLELFQRSRSSCPLISLLQTQSNLATIVVPFLAPPPPPSINFVGLMSSATQLWCQVIAVEQGERVRDCEGGSSPTSRWLLCALRSSKHEGGGDVEAVRCSLQFADRNNGNWTLDSSLAIATAYMPLKGQVIHYLHCSVVGALFSHYHQSCSVHTCLHLCLSSSPRNLVSSLLGLLHISLISNSLDTIRCFKLSTLHTAVTCVFLQEIIFPSTVAVFANENRFSTSPCSTSQYTAKVTITIIVPLDPSLTSFFAFTETNRQQNNFTTVQHFPSSSPASTCSPILYMEALAASHVCAVSPTAKIVSLVSAVVCYLTQRLQPGGLPESIKIVWRSGTVFAAVCSRG